MIGAMREKYAEDCISMIARKDDGISYLILRIST